MKKLDKIVILEDTTILETLSVINNNQKGTAIVIDEENKLLGTITDGDIRRAILDNISLNSPIKNIYNKNCIMLYESYDIKETIQYFSKFIKLIPIVDKDKRLINYLELSDLLTPKLKDNYVIIMAGGLGTRLKELTRNTPKPMLKVGHYPIMEHIIKNFKQYGYNKMLISVNYKADVIENYFKEGDSYGVKINYLREKIRLGTGGGIKLAKDYVNNPFFVINGDVFTNLNVKDMMNFHVNNEFDITVGVRRHSFQIPYGVIKSELNIIKSIDEKPVIEYLINGGIYCINPDVIDYIPEEKYYEITELINTCIKDNRKVGYYEIKDYWMDIGRMEDYNKVNEDIHNLISMKKIDEEEDSE